MRILCRTILAAVFAAAVTADAGTIFEAKGLPFEWYSRDAVHSGEYGKQIIGRIMLGYFMTGKQ